MPLQTGLRRAIVPMALSAALGAEEPPGAVPPPPAQVAANCDTPLYASDVVVCADPSLRALDRRVHEAWSAADFAASLAPGAWVEAQDAWFRRRSLCAFSERQPACLLAAYLERVAVLEAIIKAASRPPRRGTLAVCRGAPWRAATVRIRAPVTGALAVEDADGRVLATATPGQPGSEWTPYVSFATEGAAVRLQPLGAPAIDCQPTEKP